MMDQSQDASLFCYRFGAAQFDEARLELTVGGRIADLEKKPLHLLAELLRHVNEVVTRNELFDLIWGGRRTIDHVLTNAVAKLRKALGPEEVRIITVPRVGYRFVGPVERIAVGRRFNSQFEFKSGSLVPGREHFVLESQLSASPRGEVWLARHSKTKELRVFKFGTEGERLTALKREATLYRVIRESLGERDDIAKIIDWNFETPPFYLESEFGGDTLSQWTRTRADLHGYTQLQRINLFLMIAQAVEAAHSVGVLHKDLKPDNILISKHNDGTWQIRVADFGSGRLLQPGRLAELGITQTLLASEQHAGDDAPSGTILYLAPELIRGQAPTVQSDIYALGMILYQLLVGDLAKPMASGWEEDIEDPTLRTDVADATRGNPARRLRTVAELIDRLRRLEERRTERGNMAAIQLRAEIAERKVMKARTRRPWIVLAVCLVGVGVALGAWQLGKERLLLRRVEHEAARAEAINRFLANDLLGAADPSGPDGIRNPQIQEVLQRAAARLESRFLDDPATKASIELALGDAYFGLFDYDNAELYRRRAVDLLLAARGESDADTLKARYQLATVLAVRHKIDEAGEIMDAADRLAGKRLDENSQLAFQAHWSRASWCRLIYDAKRSLAEYQAVYRVQQVIDPSNITLTFRARDGISWAFLRIGASAAAELILRDMMSTSYSPQQVGPLTWAQTRLDYAAALRESKKHADAERFAKAAYAEIRDALGVDHYYTAISLIELGDVYAQEERWELAVTAYQQAEDIMRRRTGGADQGTLEALASLGEVKYLTGKPAEAVRILNPVYQALVKELGVASPQTQSAAYYLAASLCGQGQCAQAVSLSGHLEPAALVAAEPRDDWPQRIKALNEETARAPEATTKVPPQNAHMLDTSRSAKAMPAEPDRAQDAEGSASTQAQPVQVSSKAL
jgi:non-specific serine/threonine protein kinase